MHTNIALIGFMGSGKSAAGRLVAKRLGMRFVDTDMLIEKHADQTIAAIFRQHGEEYFRSLEHRVIAEASRVNNAVIACGGGAVLVAENMELLKRNSIVIYLAAAPSVILRRLSGNDKRRPLLDVPNPVAKVRLMLEKRRPLYEQAADMRINTNQLSLDALASRIEEELSRYEGRDIHR